MSNPKILLWVGIPAIILFGVCKILLIWIRVIERREKKDK